jgi:hypothetical protein
LARSSGKINESTGVAQHLEDRGVSCALGVHAVGGASEEMIELSKSQCAYLMQ